MHMCALAKQELRLMLAACHTDQMSDNTISTELMDIEFLNNQTSASACERKSGVLKSSCHTPAI